MYAWCGGWVVRFVEIKQHSVTSCAWIVTAVHREKCILTTMQIKCLSCIQVGINLHLKYLKVIGVHVSACNIQLAWLKLNLYTYHT